MAAQWLPSNDSGFSSSERTQYDILPSGEGDVVKPNKVKWTKYHISAFSITFFSYALFHVTRKTFSNVKKTMSETWSPSNLSHPEVFDEQWNGHNLYKSSDDAAIFLGTLDTVFMISYSLGLYISGAIGDRLDLRKVLAFGMCSSAVSVFLFGYVSEVTKTYSIYWYVIFWSITGLLQSTGWPSVVAVIGNWFGKSSRGLVMGIWGASPSIGNIIGAYTVGGVLHFGYEYAFLVPAGITFAGGIIVYFSLIASPRDVGLCDVDSEDSASDSKPLLPKELPELNQSVSVRPTAIGFCQAFCLPGVLPYSLAYACLKLVNYSFFFWLPYYLQSAYGWQEDEADKLSVWYDIGGIFGGILGGFISDRIGTRSPVVAFMLILSPPSLFIYNASPNNKLINAVLMTVTGFFISGVANLISTAIAADLGRQSEISNSKEALSTVTGIIDGTGSAGAAVGQILIPVLQKKIGWHFVFYLFMIMTILTLLFIAKIVYRDIRDICRKRRERNYSEYMVINSEAPSPYGEIR